MHSSLSSVAVIKYSDQEHLWEERIYLAYTGSLSIIEGKETKSGTEAGTMEVSGGCLTHRLMYASLTAVLCSPGSGAARSGLDPPTPVINQDNPLRHAHRLVCSEQACD